MANNVIVLSSEPGIQRDGTKYDSKNYIDGQWVRFYRGRPRKIGGYILIDPGTTTIIRTLYNYDNPTVPNSCDTYMGRADSVVYENFLLKPNLGQGSGEVNRTPTNYFPTYYNVNNLWDFDLFTYVNPDHSTVNYIVAHVAPNANDVTNTIPGPIYYGSTIPPNENTPLIQIIDSNMDPILVSGGVVFASPILIAYDNNGLIRYSDATGDITNWPTTNFQNIANTKIIKMVVSRGSVAPQLLAWTVNSIISLSYNIDTSGTTPTYAISWIVVPVDSTITVMSPNSIVGYANQFFWVGLNQFYFFNGIVNTLPNTMNSDFFFNDPVYGIDLEYRSHVFGEIIHPNIGLTEIWWHYTSNNPLNINKENDQAIVYIVESQKWYNTAISRSSAVSAGIFPLPMMSDNQQTNGLYPLWMHEIGWDKNIAPNNVQAIDSYFETHIYDFFEGNAANNRLMRNRRIEPDLEMDGNMTVTVHNRFFPSDTIINGRLIISGPYTFDLNTQKIDAVNSQGRLVSFRFESNEVGGTYEMGKSLLNYNIGDSRPAGAGTSGTGS